MHADPRLRARRSILFVPGTRPDRYEKALAAGADAVCIDLEDAVTPGLKQQAREHTMAFLASPASGAHGSAGPELVVRINPADSVEGSHDLEALLRAPGRPPALMLPKVNGPETLQDLTTTLTDRYGEEAPALLPLIETAWALHRAPEIALASPLVAALLFGGLDLAVELGAETDWQSLLYARSRLVHAAALAGIGAVDVPHVRPHDSDGLRQESGLARRLGFTGKLAIHPAQVAVIHEVYSPSPGEVESAQRVLDAAERAAAQGDGVIVLDGHMVDAPVVRAARSVLARAASTPSRRAP